VKNLGGNKMNTENIMFEKMRRANREMSKEECEEVLLRNNAGILSLNNVDGYPYGVPLNYFYDGDALYFHGANEGRKLNLISKDHKACFSIIDKNEVLPDIFSTDYISVILFGDIEVVEDEELKCEILRKLSKDLGCEDDEKISKYIKGSSAFCTVLKFTTIHMTGKMRK